MAEAQGKQREDSGKDIRGRIDSIEPGVKILL